MAFVHAISSAGVAHAVTRSCSAGALQHCGCDKTVGQRTTVGPGATRRGVRGIGGGSSFQWAGCSDNAAYGSAFAKLFIDAREKARGKEASRALMNLHNNNAGRKVDMLYTCGKLPVAEVGEGGPPGPPICLCEPHGLH